MSRLAGHVVIVTGGAQGIGKGTVVRLLEEGASVVIADVDPEAGRECLQEFGEPNVEFIETDVGNESAVKACITRTIVRFGVLTGLVNNAGIGDFGYKSIEEAPLEAWKRVIQTNLTGCFLMAKYAAPHLRCQQGRIVNMASTRALQSEPNTFAYSASKGGIVALTHSLAVSLGPDILVNCISPGWIDVSEWKKKELRQEPRFSAADHAQHPAGRVGGVEDIAGMVAYLLSYESGFITGQNFVIDGGMTKKMIYVE